METPTEVIQLTRAESAEFVSANILTVVAGTNCPQGGDTGHGGRTILQLTDESSTGWEIWVNGELIHSWPHQIAIVLGGDCEAETFANALLFAAAKIREKLSTVHAISEAVE